MKKIKIAIAGHANTGKTTLVRNLVRQKVGEIADRANVTPTPETVDHYSVFAEITDCPGFQEAGRILDLIHYDANFENLEKSLAERDLNEDFEAINAVRKVNVVYYVVSLDTVHDKGYQSEVQLIKKFCSKVIGIINKKTGKPSTKETSDGVGVERMKQWGQFFENNQIPFLSYDFHWDSPRTIYSLFEQTQSILDQKEALLFSDSLSEYNDSLNEDYEKIANAMISLIKKCNSIRYEAVSTNSKEYDEKLEDIKNKTFKESYTYFSEYAATLSKIYKINYNLSKEELSATNIDEILQYKLSKQFEHIAGGVAYGSGAGAVLGVYGVAKGITLGLAAAPLGPAILGGIIVGSLIGLIFGIKSGSQTQSTKKLEVKYTANDLNNVSTVAIAIAWASAYQGYGMSDIVSNDRVERLIQQDIIPLSTECGLTVDLVKDPEFEIFSKNLKRVFEKIRI